MDFKMHEFTHALVGKATPGSSSGDGIEFDEVRRQHECYLRLLRELNLEVVEVNLQGSLSDKLLLENLAIACHGIALLPRNNSSVEAHNTKILKEILQNELGQTVIDQVDPDANISCADVLFTGREFFVGISENTNEAGASAVAETFPEFPCTPIKISKGCKELKKYITMAGPDVLCVSASKEAKELLKRIEREANFTYQTLTVPEDEAANCVYVNGTLIHRAIEEIPEAFKVFCERIDFARRSICFSEFAKMQAGLSSCCLLVRKP
ncbi:N(G),N(G)-dimethylarginine dimethylaminohydrolase 1 [Spodoptera litura]|uniref:N(G),N(G)-dimethylarginine dimethylaminohydrolase 1 n=1 Tax=Spodoptera litura TaxID=69820 RepID=A0A9J7J1J1_SPOLT|nr:N(G),N(G)-dimethylarginine dimethylaminohydrolase 1 [Spodoptera litura]